MGTLSTLRAAVKAKLEATDYFSDVPVFVEDKGDIENDIARALGTLTETGGKIGVCVIVLSPLANVREPNLPGPYLEAISLVVHVEESVEINKSDAGTKKSCSDIAEAVATTLHRWTPDGKKRPVMADRNFITAATPLMGDVAYALRFTYSEGLAASE